jgi:ADP-ribosyl-[dinitrogen reductase] hydrolase
MARRYEFVREQIYGNGTIVLPRGSRPMKFGIMDNVLISDSQEAYIDHRITSEQSPYLIVDIAHVAVDPIKKGRLSVSISPGKKDNRWNRDIDLDLKSIKNNGIKVIVCLLEWSEMRMLDIVDYPRKAEESGFLFYHLPIRDCGVPSPNEINVLIPILVQHLVNGQNILIHCREGLGRAGTICACCLVHFGYDGKSAIETIRKRRPGAIQTHRQEDCIMQYYHRLINHT